MNHSWLYLLEIENEFRNSYAKIEYHWYSDKAIIFEAGVSNGKLPSYIPSTAKIIIRLKGKIIGEFYRKWEIGFISNEAIRSNYATLAIHRKPFESRNNSKASYSGW